MKVHDCQTKGLLDVDVTHMYNISCSLLFTVLLRLKCLYEVKNYF